MSRHFRLIVLLCILACLLIIAYVAGRWAEMGPLSRAYYTMSQIESAILEYHDTYQQWPSSFSDLAGFDKTLEFKDPWGRPILLEHDESKIVIRCYGKDGIVGGDGDDWDQSIEIASDSGN